VTYKRFEDLPVWQRAVDLAALSVSNNIAEGLERGTTKELLAFLYISRGSAGEVRSMLCFLERLRGFADLKSQISDLKSLAESCSRQLRGWADSLQNSDIKGQRHLNNNVRMSERQKKERELFWAEIDELARKGRS